jgi:hypothetical protein
MLALVPGRGFKHAKEHTSLPSRVLTAPRRLPITSKNPRLPGLFVVGAAGFEPATSRV